MYAVQCTVYIRCFPVCIRGSNRRLHTLCIFTSSASEAATGDSTHYVFSLHLKQNEIKTLKQKQLFMEAVTETISNHSKSKQIKHFLLLSKLSLIFSLQS